MPGHGGDRTYNLWNTGPWAIVFQRSYRFDSHRGQAYFSSSPGVDIHSEKHHKHHIHLSTLHQHIKKNFNVSFSFSDQILIKY